MKDIIKKSVLIVNLEGFNDLRNSRRIPSPVAARRRCRTYRAAR